ncbi:MAG TPA: hypothetical protein VHB01_02495 [Nitrosospira sp.]|nr:hypothetical protein [Nitrosospira sp.]
MVEPRIRKEFLPPIASLPGIRSIHAGLEKCVFGRSFAAIFAMPATSLRQGDLHGKANGKHASIPHFIHALPAPEMEQQP